MNFLRRLGQALGGRIVNEMEQSGEIDRIVNDSMAREFERLARQPEYSHVATELLTMAHRIRNPKSPPLERAT